MAASKTVVLTVMKANTESKIGVGLRTCERERTVKVTSIDPDGLFDETPLDVGMAIVSINGASCATSEECVALLMDAVGQVTIVASKGEYRSMNNKQHSTETVDGSVDTQERIQSSHPSDEEQSSDSSGPRNGGQNSGINEERRRSRGISTATFVSDDPLLNELVTEALEYARGAKENNGYQN